MHAMTDSQASLLVGILDAVRDTAWQHASRPTQANLANALGCTQPHIQKALRFFDDKHILVVERCQILATPQTDIYYEQAKRQVELRRKAKTRRYGR